HALYGARAAGRGRADCRFGTPSASGRRRAAALLQADAARPRRTARRDRAPRRARSPGAPQRHSTLRAAGVVAVAMMRADRISAAAVRIFAAALHLCPHDLRRTYGADMQITFEARCR